MQKYRSVKQIEIVEFYSDFELKLNPNNRWVQMAHLLPWDELVAPYLKMMSSDLGRPGINPRILIGAMIIKHKLKLSDRETIEMIVENPYMQYFLGYKSFQTKPAFDASLFVSIRERIGLSTFDSMTEVLILESEKFDNQDSNTPIKKGKANKTKTEETETEETKTEETKTEETKTSETKTANKGKLILDATVTDQYIPYPNDVMLLSEGREWSEKIIDYLHKEIKFVYPHTIKVRTYRQEARHAYLLFAKNKKHTKKDIRNAKKKQLAYLGRNLGHIESQLTLLQKQANWALTGQLLQRYKTIKLLYEQQKQMFDDDVNTCPNRIVNIAQDFVRPILRGKNGKRVEFGAKINLSVVNGFSRITYHSFDAFNEGTKLQDAVEQYYKTYKCYPKVVITDQIYGNKDNRAYLKENGIRFSGKKLGRPIVPDTPEKIQQEKINKKIQKQENGERNEVEAKFGTGKNIYQLNQIRAKKQNTAASSVAAIIFLTNVIRFCLLAKEALALPFLIFVKLYKRLYRAYSHSNNDHYILKHAF